jgi:hypothetical protein
MFINYIFNVIQITCKPFILCQPMLITVIGHSGSMLCRFLLCNLNSIISYLYNPKNTPAIQQTKTCFCSCSGSPQARLNLINCVFGTDNIPNKLQQFSFPQSDT